MNQDITDNPFAALFPTLSAAETFSNTSEKSIAKAEVSNDTNATKIQDIELSEKQIQVNNIIEKIFLITIDKEADTTIERPVKCVYLEELAHALSGQLHLDLQTLDQAVFERLMVSDPGDHVISTSASSHTRDNNYADESKVIRYLYHSYKRACYLLADPIFEDLLGEVIHCQDVIVMNTRTCLQQPELFFNQEIHNQLMEIYLEDSRTMIVQDSSILTEFLNNVVASINTNREDGSVKEAFTPVLEFIQSKFQNDFTLQHAEIYNYLDFLELFENNAILAEVFLDFNAPMNWENGKAFEVTLLGSILALSCIPKSDLGPYHFFNNPSSVTQQEHNITEAQIWLPLVSIGERVHGLLVGMIKLSSNHRHKVMTWLGACLHANAGRTKIWSNQMPQVFNQIYATDGFCLNLCHVMLRLSRPFSEPRSEKLLKIQPSYSAAIATDASQSKEMGVHMRDLHKETCLIASSGNQPTETTYNFITECFYMTHQCIHVGFHMVHEKYLRLNRDLHRTQRLYADARAQAGDEAEPVRNIKRQMEQGMMLYLSLKAALLEPHCLEMYLNFHIATATWLTQEAISTDSSAFSSVAFPLSDAVPPNMAFIPEFIMSNITDFTLFLNRFKQDLYEVAGDKLEHLMTLILVFMGRPDRMRNPHLRAELAETLSSLMPPEDKPGMGLLAKYHREHLFQSHSLIDHLAEVLIHVFVSIEMTGQSVEFEQKFNYRRPMYQVLDYIWKMENHRNVLRRMASDAEEVMEASDPPLFLKFINLLMNDAVFLLDEALTYMSQIKDKEQEKESGAWNALTTEQRQETEMNFTHMGSLARYHNMMSNSTIHSLELLTQQIKSIFYHPLLVERVTAMLNYFLLHLVGPKQKNINVKSKADYEFKPHEIVSDIMQIYLNLGDSDTFCVAVISDGRSYRSDLFPKAIQVLQKIGHTPQMTSDFLALEEKIRGFSEKQQEEEELLGEIPEEFLDPIMGTLMKDPVLLPTSGNITDRTTIARHILSDQTDPFNRMSLTMDMVKPQTELKSRITAWIDENKAKS